MNARCIDSGRVPETPPAHHAGLGEAALPLSLCALAGASNPAGVPDRRLGTRPAKSRESSPRRQTATCPFHALRDPSMTVTRSNWGQLPACRLNGATRDCHGGIRQVPVERSVGQRSHKRCSSEDVADDVTSRAGRSFSRATWTAVKGVDAGSGCRSGPARTGMAHFCRSCLVANATTRLAGETRKRVVSLVALIGSPRVSSLCKALAVTASGIPIAVIGRRRRRRG